MGHLFSRAFKRLTQCTNHQSSRNQAQQPEVDSRQEEPASAPAVSLQQDNINEPTETELIPVGKSIDDAGSDYVVAENGQDELKTDESTNNNTTCETPRQDVEGAVIKIQALVRGHLTRKALKDAHQHHSLPAPNALGQSQFDEESLTSGPASAIFSTASPLAMGAGFQASTQQQQPQRAANSGTNNNGNKTPLESIAEAMETSMTGGNTIAGPQLVEASAKTNDDRRRLMKLCTRSATTPAAERLEMPPTPSGADGTSPVPSEANVSIDLNTSRPPSCDTPASCSIDILDHNIKPTDKLASVLHHHQHQQHSHDQDQRLDARKEAPGPPEDPNRQSSGNLEIGERTRQWVEKGADVVGGGPAAGEVSTSADFEEEEAAAIRIQSAFRGYRTRKNSPYRTRSPTLASATSSTAGRGSSHLDPLSGQQDRGLEVDSGVEGAGKAEAEGEREPELPCPNPERRPSRPRQRGDFDHGNEDDMLAQQLVSQSTMSTSAIDYGDEDSTEAPTVLETATPALVSGTESAVSRQLVTSSGRPSGPEVSLDLTEANVSELDSSQAVSVVDTSASIAPPLDNGAANSIGAYHHHHHSQPKSEASTELDTTDSSFLGGPALSLDMVETAPAAAPTDLSTTQIGTTADEAARLVGDEDKSLGATGLGSKAMIPEEEEEEEEDDDEEVGEDEEEDGRRLVEDTDQGCALVEEAATASAEGADEGHGDNEAEKEREEDERELDQLLRAAAEEVGALNEEEQRAIELESDDIERRDPRGQASEERAKSPQIRTEPPQFAVISEPPNGSSDTGNNNTLAVETLTVDDGGAVSTSGRSSPVQNSSNGNSSEEEDDDNDSDGGTKSPTQQQQQQQQPGGKRAASRNKKRNNRNKRKGKK